MLLQPPGQRLAGAGPMAGAAQDQIAQLLVEPGGDGDDLARRAAAAPNRGFIDQLHEYHRSLASLDEAAVLA